MEVFVALDLLVIFGKQDAVEILMPASGYCETVTCHCEVFATRPVADVSSAEKGSMKLFRQPGSVSVDNILSQN